MPAAVTNIVYNIMCILFCDEILKCIAIQFAILEPNDAITVRTIDTDNEELLQLLASSDGLHIYFITEEVVSCYILHNIL